MVRAKRAAILMNLNRPDDRQAIRGITGYVQPRANWHLYGKGDPADKIRQDVFGQRAMRANMHPGYQNPDIIGPADRELSLLSVQPRDGRPLAVLANYSMRFFGSSDVSANNFGRFSQGFTELIVPLMRSLRAWLPCRRERVVTCIGTTTASLKRRSRWTATAKAWPGAEQKAETKGVK